MDLTDCSLQPQPPCLGAPYPLLVERNLAWPLFRLTTRDRLKEFMEDGSLWINTFYSLANEEKLGRGIGDINEGSRQLTYMGPLCDFNHARIMNCINAYVLCAAKSITQNMLDIWQPEVAFSIDSIEFYREISRILDRHTWGGIVQSVLYGNWSDGTDYTDWVHSTYPDAKHIDEVFPPYIGFLKDSDLKDQLEVRAVWEPKAPFAGLSIHSASRRIAREMFYADRASYRSSFGVGAELKGFLIRAPKAREYVTPLGKP